MKTSVKVVLELIRAVEERDADTVMALYHPDVEFHEAPSLPYGGSYRGPEVLASHAPQWVATWDAVQPPAERKMDPRVVAATDDEVVVLWRKRAVDARGRRFDGQVLALYEVRDDKLARAQMFHFDTAAVVEFLAHS